MSQSLTASGGNVLSKEDGPPTDSLPLFSGSTILTAQDLHDNIVEQTLNETVLLQNVTFSPNLFDLHSIEETENKKLDLSDDDTSLEQLNNSLDLQILKTMHPCESVSSDPLVTSTTSVFSYKGDDASEMKSFESYLNDAIAENQSILQNKNDFEPLPVETMKTMNQKSQAITVFDKDKTYASSNTVSLGNANLKVVDNADESNNDRFVTSLQPSNPQSKLVIIEHNGKSELTTQASIGETKQVFQSDPARSMVVANKTEDTDRPALAEPKGKSLFA